LCLRRLPRRLRPCPHHRRVLPPAGRSAWLPVRWRDDGAVALRADDPGGRLLHAACPPGPRREPAGLSTPAESQGAERLDHFMARAASAYYAGREPFGARGDFTTAPEMSQAFGECLGLWAAVVWQ